jgi:hypothetical protein
MNEEVAIEYCNKKGAEMFAIVMNYTATEEFKYILIISDNTTKNVYFVQIQYLFKHVSALRPTSEVSVNTGRRLKS